MIAIQMDEVLRQLESNEAVLLMYISGELSSSDLELVERRLADEPALQTQLDELREAHDAVAGALANLGADVETDFVGSAASRTVSRNIRDWTTRRLAGRVQAPASVAVSRYPRWFYATAAAAVLAVGVLAWWGLRAPAMPPGGSLAGNDGSQRNNFIPPAPSQPDDPGPAIESFADLGNVSAAEKQLREIVTLRESIQ
jgi:anti-sigma factor RsiW